MTVSTTVMMPSEIGPSALAYGLLQAAFSFPHSQRFRTGHVVYENLREMGWVGVNHGLISPSCPLPCRTSAFPMPFYRPNGG